MFGATTSTRRLLTVVVSAMLGCERTAPPPIKPAPDPSAADAAAQWACASDIDCMTSCKMGAVNRKWYATAKVLECHDGCANQLAAAPRCIDSSCVAFRVDPRDSSKITRDENCTRR